MLCRSQNTILAKSYFVIYKASSSVLLCLNKGHSWVSGMGGGVGFCLGRKCFGAWCAKNENGGLCMHVFHPQTMIRHARQLADAFSYTISYHSQRMRANACKTVEERWNLLKQTLPAFLRVSLEIVLAEPRPDSL